MPGGAGHPGRQLHGVPDHNVHWVAEETQAGTPGWSVPEATNAGDRELAAYFDAVSVEPGGAATCTRRPRSATSTSKPSGSAGTGRVGAREVAFDRADPRPEQSAPLKASDGTISTNWQPTTTVDTAGWPEGSYLFLMTAKKGSKTRYVRSSSGRRSTADAWHSWRRS